MNGKIFCFMGKSASGKDTIFKELSKAFPSISEIIPYTTRPIRENETNGIQYNFVTEEIFKFMLDNNMVIESRSYNTKHGIWTYFTASSNIDSNNNYMIINTLEGYQKISKYFGKENVIPIYIEVEDGIRLERALERERKEKNPKYSELCRRFLADQEDFSESNILQAGIQIKFANNDLDECITEIKKYIIDTINKDKNKVKIKI